LLIGLQVRITRWSELKNSALRTALVVSLVTAGSVVGIPALLLTLLAPDYVVFNALPLLLCAGAVAMVAADAPIRSLAAFLGASGPATGLATRTARFCSSIAVVFFGLIFCFYHVGEIVPFDTARWLQWLVIHLVLGVILGRIFDAFLQQDYSDDKVLTIAIGMVIFASGLAYGLQLSPVFVNFIMGLALSALGRNAERARRMLLRIKHPLYIALFIFAGARLDISVPMLTYALVVPYLVFRIGGRVVGGWLSAAPNRLHPRTPGMGRILLSPGALSIAIALDFLMIPIRGGDPTGGVKHIGVVGTLGGGELILDDLKDQIGTIIGIFAAFFLLIVPVTAGAVYGLTLYTPSLVPFLQSAPSSTVFAVALLFGVFGFAMSPAATLAIIQEARSSGKFTSLVLGVVIVADVVLVASFLITQAFAEILILEGTIAAQPILSSLPGIAAEFGWALVIGLATGLLFIAYFRFVAREMLFFTVGAIFVASFVCDIVHAEKLLAFLTAGFIVQNLSRHGHTMIEALESISMPAFVVYFTIKAAELNLQGIASVLALTGILTVIRTAML